MTLHEQIRSVYSAIAELLEIAHAIAKLREHKCPLSGNGAPLLVLDAVVFGANDLERWEAATAINPHASVKLLFADYKSKKEALVRLLSRDLMASTEATSK